MKAFRILVMEDDALIGMLLTEMLEGMGHGVCAVAATEADAVAAAAQHKPDMMIVDARLRHGSGIVAVEEILRTGFIAHVFISGDAATVRQLRPDDVIVEKPFRESDLVGAMQRALDAPTGRAPALQPT